MTTAQGDDQIGGKRITVPERFEKTRLALLSYSAITVALCLAAQDTPAPGSPHPVSPTTVLFSIPINMQIAQILIWLAALSYYLVFRLSDAPSVKVIYSPLLEGVTWAELKDQLQRYERLIENANAPALDLVETNLSLRESARAAIEEHMNLITSYDLSEVKEQLDKLARNEVHTTGNPELDKQITRNPVLWFGHTLNRFPHRTAASLAAVAHEITNLENLRAGPPAVAITHALEKSSEGMRSAVGDLERFSRNIFDQERRRFDWWEVAAPKGLFWLATAALAASLTLYFWRGTTIAGIFSRAAG